MSENTGANVKAAIMQLKEEQVLGWVQDQLDRKASPIAGIIHLRAEKRTGASR
jgi:hypothetical protein